MARAVGASRRRMTHSARTCAVRRAGTGPAGATRAAGMVGCERSRPGRRALDVSAHMRFIRGKTWAWAGPHGFCNGQVVHSEEQKA